MPARKKNLGEVLENGGGAMVRRRSLMVLTASATTAATPEAMYAGAMVEAKREDEMALMDDMLMLEDDMDDEYVGSASPKTKRSKKSRDRALALGTRVQLRCTAIQKFLLDNTTGSERSIREVFGNNPDTSKALRMLVKAHRVKRFGTGGKQDPFIYMALTPPGVNELERLMEAKSLGISF